MRQAMIWSLLALSVAPVSPAERAEALVVTAVRFWSLSDVTRVAIETNGAFRYHSDKLDKPERIFFDLLGAKPRMGTRGIHTTNVDDRLLKRMQTRKARKGLAAAFDATPAALGRAAVKATTGGVAPRTTRSVRRAR